MQILKSIVNCLLLTILMFFCSAPANSAGAAVVADPAPVKIGADVAQRIIEETPEGILWQLPDQKQVWLSKGPKRVVILLTSLLDLWYEAEGTAVGRCAGKLNVPSSAFSLPVVGTFNNPNLEKIIALEPDLVISPNLPSFRNLLPVLEQNNIEYAYFDYVNFYDYSRILTLFAKLNGSEDQVAGKLTSLQHEIHAVQDSIRGYSAPRVLIVFTTANAVSCELQTSQTGVMLSMLGAENIIPARFAGDNRTRVQFSLERIVGLDPDMILVNTMGDVEECTARLTSEFAGNAAWAGLRAIKQGHFHVLPKEMFLYKSNDQFPVALNYLAEILYGAKR